MLSSLLPFLFMLIKGSMDMFLLVASVSALYFYFIFNNSLYFTLNFWLDDVSLALIIMSMLILMLIGLILLDSYFKLFLMGLAALLMIAFFESVNFLLFFIVFELSLIPIFFLMISSGFQVERLKAGRWMLIYTLLASSPLLVLVVYYMMFYNIVYMNTFLFYSFLVNPINEWVFIGFLTAFAVKVPVFVFHSWLPKAHVEAPLEGSMVLAGIMLKMGVYGFIRLMYLLYMFSFSNSRLVFFSTMIMGSIISCWLAISSDDIKMVVAYSSVSHMNFTMASLMTMKFMSLVCCVAIMVAHGLCSSLLFFLVTKVYIATNSRSSLINKGFCSLMPSLMFVSFVGWSLNLSVPPSISFLGEMWGMVCITSLSIFGLLLSLLYVLLNSFYSSFNFGLSSHSNVSLSFKFFCMGVSFYFISLCLLLPLLVLFFFFDFLF